MWVSIRFSRESLKLRQLQLPRSGPNGQPPESQHLERDDFVFESSSRSIFLFEHDLFGKPVPTFPDHALAAAVSSSSCAGHRNARVSAELFGLSAKRIRSRFRLCLCEAYYLVFAAAAAAFFSSKEAVAFPASTIAGPPQVGGPLLPHPPAKKRTVRSMSPFIIAFSRSV